MGRHIQQSTLSEQKGPMIQTNPSIALSQQALPPQHVVWPQVMAQQAAQLQPATAPAVLESQRSKSFQNLMPCQHAMPKQTAAIQQPALHTLQPPVAQQNSFSLNAAPPAQHGFKMPVPQHVVPAPQQMTPESQVDSARGGNLAATSVMPAAVALQQTLTSSSNLAGPPALFFPGATSPPATTRSFPALPALSSAQSFPLVTTPVVELPPSAPTSPLAVTRSLPEAPGMPSRAPMQFSPEGPGRTPAADSSSTELGTLVARGLPLASRSLSLPPGTAPVPGSPLGTSRSLPELTGTPLAEVPPPSRAPEQFSPVGLPPNHEQPLKPPGSSLPGTSLPANGSAHEAAPLTARPPAASAPVQFSPRGPGPPPPPSPPRACRAGLGRLHSPGLEPQHGPPHSMSRAQSLPALPAWHGGMHPGDPRSRGAPLPHGHGFGGPPAPFLAASPWPRGPSPTYPGPQWHGPREHPDEDERSWGGLLDDVLFELGM